MYGDLLQSFVQVKLHLCRTMRGRRADETQGDEAGAVYEDFNTHLQKTTWSTSSGILRGFQGEGHPDSRGFYPLQDASSW